MTTKKGFHQPLGRKMADLIGENEDAVITLDATVIDSLEAIAQNPESTGSEVLKLAAALMKISNAIRSNNASQRAVLEEKSRR